MNNYVPCSEFLCVNFFIFDKTFYKAWHEMLGFEKFQCNKQKKQNKLACFIDRLNYLPS